ncbi:hypothetical protein AC579_5427 [Pseudocercospora musae]|uniref:Uncharacterized protein n=1 Tax=Pseudocercospora musae TaxID=113226 RepID=A0A139H1Q9_9PEZI|nr:hypothetical protein AC579_5427 [Pseudocercospora musae]
MLLGISGVKNAGAESAHLCVSYIFVTKKTCPAAPASGADQEMRGTPGLDASAAGTNVARSLSLSRACQRLAVRVGIEPCTCLRSQNENSHSITEADGIGKDSWRNAKEVVDHATGLGIREAWPDVTRPGWVSTKAA